MRATSRRPEDLVEVDLGEGTVGPSPAAGRPRHPWSTRLWQAAAGLLAVLLAAGSWADGARAADLAPAGPGLAGDLRLPRHEAWRAEGRPIAAAADVVVLREPDGRHLRGLDPADGRLLWRVVESTTGCGLVDLDSGVFQGPGPASAAPAARLRLVCAAGDLALAGDGGSTTILDPSSGEVLARGATAAPGFTVAGGLLLAVHREDGGAAVLTARSLEDGHEAWRRAVREGWETGWQVTDGRVLISGTGEAFDLRSGAPVAPPAWKDLDPFGLRALPRGLRVEWTELEGGSGTAVRGPGGAVLWTAVGTPALPTAPDATSVVPVRTGQSATEVRDLRDGTVLWSVEGVFVPLADADGLLVALVTPATGGRSQVVGYDERTGAVRWQLPRPFGSWDGTTLVSDGRRFLLPDESGDTVEVRDLSNGSLVGTWAPPLRDGTGLLTLPGGRVAQTSADEVVVLGW